MAYERVYGLEITTIDILGDKEVMFIPRWNEINGIVQLADDEPEFGENGFDVSDYINPDIYVSVNVRGVYR